MSETNLPHFMHCGLPGVDRVPAGMHACHFYTSRDDLVGALVPYIITGLRENERCLCITAPPLPASEAIQAMRAAYDGVDDAIQAGALRILNFDQWYGSSGRLKGPDVLVQSWLDEEERALADGYQGLRIAGNASFLKPGDWSTFMQYEQALNASLNGHRILTLCSYARPQFDDRQFSEVMRAHHCAFEGPDVHGQVVAVPQSPKMRDLPMKKEEPMADRGTQSTQVSETMHCPDCHSKMNWYRSMQVGDEAPATVTHFFQCPDCNRVQEKRVQADINGVPSDPVLPLTAR